MKKVEENSSNDVGSEAFKTLETDLNAFQETGIWNCSLCENKEKTFSHKFQLVTHWHETHSSKDAVFEVCQWCMELFFSPGSSAKVNNGILLPKLFWPIVRKNVLVIEAEGREFAKILRSLDQFVRTVNGQTIFGNRMLF